MDYYNKHETLNTTNYSSKLYSYTRNVVQLLVLASVFSFLYSQSFASNFSIKFFACSTERNCVFLLCNGILVLIIRTSGLVSKIYPVINGVDDHHGEKVREDEVSQEKIKANVVNRKAEHLVQENIGGDQSVAIEEVRDGKSRNKKDLEEVYDQNHENEDIEVVEEEEEEEEEEGLDELNKKFEEFIKKMKQAIRA